MSDDLVKRLRSYEVFISDGVGSPLAFEAADRIAALEAEVERLQDFRRLFGRYAATAGENWRCGEGAYLMDAYAELAEQGGDYVAAD